MELNEQYKELEGSDWNKGNECKTLPLQRVKLHNLWLEKMHREVKYTPTKQANVVEGINFRDEKDFQGFVKF